MDNSLYFWIKSVSGQAAAQAMFNNATFGLRFRVPNVTGAARYVYIDNFQLAYYTYSNLATSCTGACAPPDQPAILNIIDNNACAQDGIKVYYAGSLGAASYNLMKDGVALATGYTSGALADPGDSANHSYTIRAVNGSGYTDSAAQNFVDAAQSITPTITCTPGTCTDTTQVVLTTERKSSPYPV